MNTTAIPEINIAFYSLVFFDKLRTSGLFLFLALSLSTVIFAQPPQPQKVPIIPYYPFPVSAEEPEKPDKPRLQWNGYISCDYIADTYLGFTRRNGHEFLYPLRPFYSKEGENIFDRGLFAIIPINSGLFLTVDGLQACGADVVGFLHADFRGLNDETDYLLRLRQAFINFDWCNILITTGLTFHPFFVVDCFPHRVSYAGATVFCNHDYVPQLRATFRFRDPSCWFHHEVLWYFFDECRGLRSNGPDGPTVRYAHEAAFPGCHLQWRCFLGNLLLGIGAEVHKILPRLISDEGFLERSTVVPAAVGCYAAYTDPNVILRGELVYTHGGFEDAQLSGYGVRTRQPFTDCRTYEPQRSLGIWGDVDFAPSCWINPGLFCGYYQNFGCDKPLYRTPAGKLIVYGDNPYVQHLWRFVPRLWIANEQAVRLGLEIEWTRAHFGNLDDYGKPADCQEADNVRFLASIIYSF